MPLGPALLALALLPQANAADSIRVLLENIAWTYETATDYRVEVSVEVRTEIDYPVRYRYVLGPAKPHAFYSESRMTSLRFAPPSDARRTNAPEIP